jgi:hypothetical protein
MDATNLSWDHRPIKDRFDLQPGAELRAAREIGMTDA